MSRSVNVLSTFWYRDLDAVNLLVDSSNSPESLWYEDSRSRSLLIVDIQQKLGHAADIVLLPCPWTSCNHSKLWPEHHTQTLTADSWDVSVRGYDNAFLGG